jgi:hypothetical protein
MMQWAIRRNCDKVTHDGLIITGVGIVQHLLGWSGKKFDGRPTFDRARRDVSSPKANPQLVWTSRSPALPRCLSVDPISAANLKSVPKGAALADVGTALSGLGY